MMKIVAILTLFFVLAMEAPAQDGQVFAPVFKPTFMTGYDSFSGGTAFVTKEPAGEGLLLVTALHLFGPACGLKEQLTSEEVCEAFHAVTGIGMDDYRKFVTSTSPILLKSANVPDDGCAGDLALYRLPHDAVSKPLVFSGTSPKVGDTVYLIGRQRGSEKLERIKASVIEVDGSNLVYRFERAELNAAGTSGAPVVNEKGEVVGMNTNGGEEDGVHFGFANPTSAILKLIKESSQKD